ncbi:hypothetical protein AAFF_G00011690 [Aldrovandia affinis]|uniref:Vasohibin-1 n=1 Tax=Aldrovandia affinis TaxID=143900 RepID=A0AAD7S8S3_9TELE|nr:hypothetical protein AAFF_G00011690 [Aldrovandia affinis]
MSGDRTAGAGGVLRSTTGCEVLEQREEEQEDEGDEDMRDGGMPFFVNRGGLPVNEDTWERMWRHVSRIHPAGEAVGGSRELVTCLRVPHFLGHCRSALEQGTEPLTAPGAPYYVLRSDPSDVVYASRRVQSVLSGWRAGSPWAWGVVSSFLDSSAPSSYLTNSMPGVERFPLSFKTQFSGNYFRHIVLGVHSGGRFGALGISRREDLMFKPLEFRTLADLVQEFESAYRGYWHGLCKVKIGQYVSHDPHSVEQIDWKHSILDVDKLSKEELRRELERHTRDMRLKTFGGEEGAGAKSSTDMNGYQIRV